MIPFTSKSNHFSLFCIKAPPFEIRLLCVLNCFAACSCLSLLESSDLGYVLREVETGQLLNQLLEMLSLILDGRQHRGTELGHGDGVKRGVQFSSAVEHGRVRVVDFGFHFTRRLVERVLSFASRCLSNEQRLLRRRFVLGFLEQLGEPLELELLRDLLDGLALLNVGFQSAGHIYPRLKSSKESLKQTQAAVVKKQDNSLDSSINITDASSGVPASSPIPLPALRRHNSLERELYYTSARSLSKSHTPTIGAFLAQRRSASLYQRNSVEEPLLGGDSSPRSAPSSNVKTMLCVFSAVTFVLGTFNLHPSSTELNQGVAIRVGRKLLQVTSGLKQETGGIESSGVGTYLGWGMAVIYMGGRLPQICLNIQRGHVEGLNPLMFVFALVGNITYVGSILVDSLEWSKIKANLPWLVDAGGCVILDSFILLQFMYFRCRTRQDAKDKHQNVNNN